MEVQGNAISSVESRFHSDNYELIEKIGEGGFGQIYKAKQLNTDQLVAIKFLTLSNEFDRAKRRRYIERFERETLLCSRLQHPNVVRLLDKGICDDGLLYAVFEYVDGKSLKQVLTESGALAPVEAGMVMGQVLDALTHAHEQGVIHRDIKPANIMLTKVGVKTHVKVLDFGIGTLVKESRHLDYKSLTLTQETLGTPSYSAPEQLRGEPPTPQTDLYVWGLVFIECLTGAPAVSGTSLASIFHKQLSQSNVPLPAAIAGHPISSLLRRALNKKVNERVAKASDLYAELNQLHLSSLVGTIGESNANYGDLDTATKLSSGVDDDTLINEYGKSFTRLTERKQITVLCVSLKVKAASDIEVDHEVIDALHHDQKNQCVDTAVGYGAFHVGTLGDTLMFYFGYPSVSDNDARLCARAALDITSGLAKRNSLLKESQGICMQAQLGMHTGMVTTYPDAVPEGETPNIALELSRATEPGHILCSEVAKKVLEPYLEFESSSVVTLGVQEELQTTFLLSGERQVEAFGFLRGTRRNEAFIGRENEVDLLTNMLSSLDGKECPKDKLAHIYGEAGIGKSRLVFEVREKAKDFQHYVAQCLPEHQNNALYPVLNLLRYKYSLESIDENCKQSVLIKAIDDIELSERGGLANTLPILFTWLNIHLPDGMQPSDSSPEKQKELLFKVVSSLLKFRLDSDLDKSLFIFEDMHWSDPTSIEFLNYFSQSVKSDRSIVISTSRDKLPNGFDNRYIKEVYVSKLGRSSSEGFIKSLFDDEKVASNLIEILIDRTDGIPLFIEELVNMLQQKRLVHKLNGIIDFVSPDKLDDVPVSLRDSLQQKLDSLVYSKETAQLSAVIGREFSYELLIASSAHSESQVQNDLNELVRLGLVYQQRKVNGDSYIFKHALVRDAAYDSIGSKAVKAMHSSIAINMENSYSSSSNFYDSLAHHYSKSENYQKSTEHGLAFARSLCSKSLNIETEKYIGMVLAWAQKIESESLSLLRERDALQLLSPVTMALEGYGSSSVLQINKKIEEISEKIACETVSGEEEKLLKHTNMWHKAQVHHMNTERDKARSIFEELVLSARVDGSRRRLVDSLPFLALCMTTDGEVEQSLSVYEEALSIYDPESDTSIGNVNGTDPKCHAHLNYSLALAILGRYSEAQENIDLSMDWSENINHGFSKALTLCYQMYLLAIKEDRKAALEMESVCREFFKDNEEFDFLFSYVRAVIDWAKGFVEFQIDFSKGRIETGQTYLHSFYEYVLALTYIDIKDFSSAKSTLEKSIIWSEGSGERAFVRLINSKLSQFQ